MGGKGKKCRKERVNPVAANPDNLESNKEAGGGAQGTQGSSKNCTSRESMPPLSRLDDRAGLRGYLQFNNYTHTHTHFATSIIDPPLGGSTRVA